ncbi:MAG: hypothetical protein MUQ56_10370 [Thermoleophilia bacterium]|nr:hypothetical protein [Thermoleophilia bacterium]
MLLGNTWRLDLASHVADAVNCRVNVPTPAAFILHKGLSFKARRDTLKKEKDLYYVFYIVDGFPEWANWIRLDLPGLASRTPAWFRQCAANLDQAFSTPGSAGVDALLRQRPETAYPGMSPDQFRQYAWGAMRELVGTMMVG